MGSIEENLEKSFLIRAIEWGVEHPDGFTVQQILEDQSLALKDFEKEIIRNYFSIAWKNYYNMYFGGRGPISADSLFLVLTLRDVDQYDNEDNRYIISLDSQFSFIDYIELKRAGINAKEAKRQAMWAIGISVIAIVVPVVIAICFTQDVKIDHRQIESIVRACMNK